MNNDQILSHTAWKCTYHVVWIPKYRKKTRTHSLFGCRRQARYAIDQV
jgi:REP element-mobilizing transposase RayT